MQPIVADAEGVQRFKSNTVVEYLRNVAEKIGMDINKLSLIPFPREDWEQFMQLTGYSVCGYCDLSLVSDKSKDAAWAAAERAPESDCHVPLLVLADIIEHQGVTSSGPVAQDVVASLASELKEAREYINGLDEELTGLSSDLKRLRDVHREHYAPKPATSTETP